MSEQRQDARRGEATSLRAGFDSARWALLGFGIIVGLWELTARFFIEFPIVLPAPSAVWETLTDNPAIYLRETGYTLYTVTFGFVGGFVIGFVSAVLIHYSPFLSRTVYPVLVAVRIVPKVAFIPLLAIWFGIGPGTKIAVAILGGFFLVLVQTLLGLRGLSQELVELGRSLQMDESLIFRKMRLPAALPAIMVGVKLSITHALTLVVVAEMSMADRGVGWIIIDSRARFQTAEMLGGIVVIAIAGLALYQLGRWIERRTTFWNVEERI